MMIFGAGDGRQLVFCALRGAHPPGDDGLPVEVRHLAFSVTTRDEVAEWRRRLETKGVEHREEDHGSQVSVYFTDPNGHTLEITGPASNQAVTANGEAASVIDAWVSASRP
jgi:catechol 2,3-dioxygenase-like lactoylglutathione lyase family enzyme